VDTLLVPFNVFALDHRLLDGDWYLLDLLVLWPVDRQRRLRCIKPVDFILVLLDGKQFWHRYRHPPIVEVVSFTLRGVAGL